MMNISESSKKRSGHDVLRKGFRHTLLVVGNSSLKNGMPSLYQISRVKKAASLWKKNNYSKLLLTGGAVACAIPEAIIERALAVKFGIPAQKILIEDRSRSTLQNALFAYEILKDTDLRKLTVVTSDFHMQRARFIFKKVFGHMDISIKFEAAELNEPRMRKLWLGLKERYYLGVNRKELR